MKHRLYRKWFNGVLSKNASFSKYCISKINWERKNFNDQIKNGKCAEFSISSYSSKEGWKVFRTLLRLCLSEKKSFDSIDFNCNFDDLPNRNLTMVEKIKKLKELANIAKENKNSTFELEDLISKIESEELFSVEIETCSDLDYFCDVCGNSTIKIDANCLRCLSGYGICIIMCGKCGKIYDYYHYRS